MSKRKKHVESSPFARFDDEAWRIYQDRSFATAKLARFVERRGNIWRYFP